MTTEQQIQTWVERRRDGESTQRIADEAGVSRQWVSQCTAGSGPFPGVGASKKADVERWVALRREGHAITAIAHEEGVGEARVSRATAPFGPFPYRRGDPREVGVTQFAQLLGVSLTVMTRWIESGGVPPPQRVDERGHRSWSRAIAQEWIANLDVPTCPTCGAKPRDLGRHIGAVHDK